MTNSGAPIWRPKRHRRCDRQDPWWSIQPRMDNPTQNLERRVDQAVDSPVADALAVTVLQDPGTVQPCHGIEVQFAGGTVPQLQKTCDQRTALLPGAGAHLPIQLSPPPPPPQPLPL